MKSVALGVVLLGSCDTCLITVEASLSTKIQLVRFPYCHLIQLATAVYTFVHLSFALWNCQRMILYASVSALQTEKAFVSNL